MKYVVAAGFRRELYLGFTSIAHAARVAWLHETSARRMLSFTRAGALTAWVDFAAAKARSAGLFGRAAIYLRSCAAPAWRTWVEHVEDAMRDAALVRRAGLQWTSHGFILAWERWVREARYAVTARAQGARLVRMRDALNLLLRWMAAAAMPGRIPQHCALSLIHI